MSIETKETSSTKELKHGHTVVGLVAVPLTGSAEICDRGVLIRAPGVNDPIPNTGLVWIGRRHVTADSDEGTGGVPLEPGANIVIPVEDPSTLYVISNVDNQDVAWMGI